MTRQIIRTGSDTWVGSADPSARHPADNRLTVQSGAAVAYIYFPLGHDLRGATILVARMYLYGMGSGWGTTTATVKRVIERWPVPLTWNNRPDVVGTDQAVVTQTNPGDNTEWEFDVTQLVQMYASGERWFGVRVGTDSGAARQYKSMQAVAGRPRLEVVYTEAPAAPTDLVPDGDRIVAPTRPVLRWTHSDEAGDTDLAAVQVQTNGTDVWTSPNWDSGRVVSTVPQFDLAAWPGTLRSVTGGTRTSGSPTISAPGAGFTTNDQGAPITGTGIPAGTKILSVSSSTTATMTANATSTVSGSASFTVGRSPFPVLSEGQRIYWRAREQDGAGLWSRWSEAAVFQRQAKGTLTITTPGSTVAELTPPVAWSSSKPQERWQVLVVKPTDQGIVHHDSGRNAGASTSYTIPKGVLRDTRLYRVIVRSWDSTDREGTPGDRPYTEAFRDFTVVEDETPNRVTNLVATQVGVTPYVDLTWTRATTPDKWVILRNDKVIDSDILGPELLVSGTSYKYRDKDAPPHRLHTYKVRPTVNGKSPGSPTITITTRPKGIWVLGVDDIDVCIAGDDPGSWTMVDTGTNFLLVGAGQEVRVTGEVGGWSGSLSGTLVPVAGRSADSWRDRMLALKSRPDQPVWIYAGAEAFRADIFNIVVAPTPDPVNNTRQVSFDFVQLGEPDWL
jgi:hypothetical protein